MYRLAAIVVVAALCSVAPAQPAAAEAAPRFPDLAGHWARDDVMRGVELGFLDGYPDGTFRPDGSVTRAEFAKMVAAAFKLERAAGKAVFQDCRGTWFEPYLVAACSAAVVVPEEYGAFYRPDEPIPRAEAAAYLVRALGRGGSAALRDPGDAPFDDCARVPAFYRGAVAEAAVLGILKGYPDGTVRGESGCTRAEAVVLVLRAVDAKSRAREQPSVTAVPEPGEAAYVAQGSLLAREVVTGKEWTLPCEGEFTLSWKPVESVVVAGVKGLESYAAGALPDPEHLVRCLAYLPCPKCEWGKGLLALLASPWPEEFSAGDVRPDGPGGEEKVDVAWTVGSDSLALEGSASGPFPASSEGQLLLRRDLRLRWEARSGEVRGWGDLSSTVWYDPARLWVSRVTVLLHGVWQRGEKEVVASGQFEARLR
ncbi:MAG: S-layer homology domain-containing protein [Bacillota bacterium]|nr:S-layer homology domain-containing protein [Bacillota bacterium]